MILAKLENCLGQAFLDGEFFGSFFAHSKNEHHLCQLS
jgi:hypothetical protein